MAYNCEIMADSVAPNGDRLTTFKLTYPRIIHAEMLRHRMLSRNVASSRAIPFEKMVKDVQKDPFIPIAWQKNHPGMQGTEYLSKTDTFNLSQFVSSMIDTLHSMVDIDSKEYLKFEKDVDYKVELITGLLSNYTHLTMTLDEWWLFARDKAIESASILYVFSTTKQLCNRILEPFVWTTELVSGTEWENFFSLRCPKYYFEPENLYFKSRKEFGTKYNECFGSDEFINWTEEKWLSINDSQAEIHIQKIAEMMWDTMNESAPKTLRNGEWHIPYGNDLDSTELANAENLDINESTEDLLDSKLSKLKVATARAARISYTTLGDNPKIDYEADIKLHDRLLESKHLSCFEHCARVMSNSEFDTFHSGSLIEDNTSGWCNNFRGFIQYRHLVEK